MFQIFKMFKIDKKPTYNVALVAKIQEIAPFYQQLRW